MKKHVYIVNAHPDDLIAAAGLLFSIALGIFTVKRMSKKK